jgi:hypothetical protein
VRANRAGKRRTLVAQKREPEFKEELEGQRFLRIFEMGRVQFVSFLFLLTLGASLYVNSLSGSFLFDDLHLISPRC